MKKLLLLAVFLVFILGCEEYRYTTGDITAIRYNHKIVFAEDLPPGAVNGWIHQIEDNKLYIDFINNNSSLEIFDSIANRQVMLAVTDHNNPFKAFKDLPSDLPEIEKIKHEITDLDEIRSKVLKVMDEHNLDVGVYTPKESGSDPAYLVIITRYGDITIYENSKKKRAFKSILNAIEPELEFINKYSMTLDYLRNRYACNLEGYSENYGCFGRCEGDHPIKNDRYCESNRVCCNIYEDTWAKYSTDECLKYMVGDRYKQICLKYNAFVKKDSSACDKLSSTGDIALCKSFHGVN